MYMHGDRILTCSVGDCGLVAVDTGGDADGGVGGGGEAPGLIVMPSQGRARVDNCSRQVRNNSLAIRYK